MLLRRLFFPTPYSILDRPAKEGHEGARGADRQTYRCTQARQSSSSGGTLQKGPWSIAACTVAEIYLWSYKVSLGQPFYWKVFDYWRKCNFLSFYWCSKLQAFGKALISKSLQLAKHFLTKSPKKVIGKYFWQVALWFFRELHSIANEIIFEFSCQNWLKFLVWQIWNLFFTTVKSVFTTEICFV